MPSSQLPAAKQSKSNTPNPQITRKINSNFEAHLNNYIENEGNASGYVVSNHSSN